MSCWCPRRRRTPGPVAGPTVQDLLPLDDRIVLPLKKVFIPPFSAPDITDLPCEAVHGSMAGPPRQFSGPLDFVLSGHSAPSRIASANIVAARYLALPGSQHSACEVTNHDSPVRIVLTPRCARVIPHHVLCPALLRRVLPRSPDRAFLTRCSNWPEHRPRARGSRGSTVRTGQVHRRRR